MANYEGSMAVNSTTITGTAIQERATLESLLALSDQLDAATRDVGEAWSQFVYGSQPESPDRAAPATTDRIEHCGQTLQENVARLRQLAEEIRSRA